MLDKKTSYQYSFILQELNAEIKTNAWVYIKTGGGDIP